MTAIGYCPQCGHRRVSNLRFCSQCRFDFESIRLATPGSVTSLMRAPGTPGPVVPAAASAEPTARDNASQMVPIIAGVAWLIGAAAVGYLAFLQLQYSGLGLADADDARGLALWNGATAAITAYFGAMAIVAPSRGRMGGAVLWAVINVAWGGYQVSQGLTHEAFILALVAFAVAGVLAFVSWSRWPKSPARSSES